MDELVNEIYDELSTELGISEEADLSMLLVKVKNAYREIKKIRNYPDNYTDDTVNKDMEKYFSMRCRYGHQRAGLYFSVIREDQKDMAKCLLI